MDERFAALPETEGLRGAEASEPTAESNGGEAVKAGARRRVVPLPDAADSARAHGSSQLTAGEAAPQQLPSRRDSAQLIEDLRET